MSEFNIILGDLTHLRHCAITDRDRAVVVRALTDRTFAIFLSGFGEAQGIALSAPEDPTSLHVFDDLGACVRTAVEIAYEGHVFFDLPF